MDRFEAVVVVVVLIMWKQREREETKETNCQSMDFQLFLSKRGITFGKKRCRGMCNEQISHSNPLPPQSSTHGKQENELTLMS